MISSNATVEPGAVVGSGSVLWDGVTVRSGAVVGEDCVFGRAAFVDGGVIIGDRCKVQDNALLYSPAVLEDGVFIGPGVILTNDRFPRAVNSDGTRKSAGDWVAEGVVVESGASIGAGAVVLGGVRVGRWSLIAANATVTSDVPPFALVAGSPARRIGWVGPAGRPLVSIDRRTWRCPETGAGFVSSGDSLEEL